MSEVYTPPNQSEITVSRLTIDNQEIIDLESGKPFDARDYSLYKYGCGEAADHIASAVTDKLLTERASILEQGGPDILEHYYITSSAYKHVPTAAYYVTRRMVGELAATGHPPVGLVRIDRQVTKSGDYSAMSEADRQRYIADNNVHVPTICLKEVADKTVIVVDDIKNTGSNERSFAAALRQAKVGRMIFCYAAVIAPELAETYPKVESDLNQAYVKTLDELALIAERPDFEVNARICRFLMDATRSSEEIADFVTKIPYQNARAILAGITSDGYHTLPEYGATFRAFQLAVRQQRSRVIAQNIQHGGLAKRAVVLSTSK